MSGFINKHPALTGWRGALDGNFAQWEPTVAIPNFVQQVNAEHERQQAQFWRDFYGSDEAAQAAEAEARLQLVVDHQLQQKGRVGVVDLVKQKCMVLAVGSGAVVSWHATEDEATKAVKQRISQDRGEYVIYVATQVIRPKPIETEVESL